MKRQRNSFLTPLIVEVMPSGKTFRLFKQFTYNWKRYAPTIRAVTIHVPVGFVTDFASIPRFIRFIIPKLGKYNKAAVLHDYAYQFGTISRKQADQLFLDAMKDLGVLKWKRYTMYWAVRAFGFFAWRKR